MNRKPPPKYMQRYHGDRWVAKGALGSLRRITLSLSPELTLRVDQLEQDLREALLWRKDKEKNNATLQ